MNPIHIFDLKRRADGQFVELSAGIRGLRRGSTLDRLWFRVPAELESWLTTGAEPMVAALLPIAMQSKQSLHVDAPVDPRFLNGCRQIMQIYSRWDSRLHEIEISCAKGHVAESRRPVANGAFFSGGVDSFYTLLKNLRRERGENRISHIIYVRGYADCPLDNQQLFENLSRRFQQVADALHVRLILTETNLTAFTPPPGIEWDWYAGSQLAAIGLCLQKGLRRLLIPAGDTYATLSPWGSHPLIDPLWSTELLEFLHDGCEAFRSEKLGSLVARSSVALQNLRVCGYDFFGLSNCGMCEKCLRTLIGLAALGIEPPSGVFATGLDSGRIKQLNGGDRVIAYYLRDNLRLLRATGRAPELERAVQQALQPGTPRRLGRKLSNVVRELDRRFLGSHLRSWALQRAGANAESHSDLRIAPAKWALLETWRWATATASSNSDGEDQQQNRRPA